MRLQNEKAQTEAAIVEAKRKRIEAEAELKEMEERLEARKRELHGFYQKGASILRLLAASFPRFAPLTTILLALLLDLLLFYHSRPENLFSAHYFSRIAIITSAFHILWKNKIIAKASYSSSCCSSSVPSTG